MSAIVKTTPFAELSQYAKAFADSGLFNDTRQAAQAIVKIQAGAEMGFAPFASMTGVHIIQGKVSLGANLMAAAVARSGKYRFKVKTHTETECAIEFYQGSDLLGTSTFTMKDANAASLTGKAVWKSFPRNMLYARAMSNGIRWYCPDVLGGGTIYTPEEVGAEVDEDGAPVKVANTAPTTPAPSEPEPTDSREQVEGEVVDTNTGELVEEKWVKGHPESTAMIAGQVFGAKVHRSGVKKDGSPWTVYAIRLTDGRCFCTWSESLFAAAQKAKDSTERLEFSGRYDKKGEFFANEIVPPMQPAEPVSKSAPKAKAASKKAAPVAAEISEEDIPF